MSRATAAIFILALVALMAATPATATGCPPRLSPHLQWQALLQDRPPVWPGLQGERVLQAPDHLHQGQWQPSSWGQVPQALPEEG